MIPVDFEQANVTFGPPEGMTEQQCGSLQAFKGIDENGFPFLFSVWKPSEEEIKNVNLGMPVRLKMFSHSFIPTALFVVDHDKVES